LYCCSAAGRRPRFSPPATLYDSAGNDPSGGLPGFAYLAGSGFVIQAHGFQTVTAISAAGGQDTATLYGAPSGNSTFPEGFTLGDIW
jgi:hypothetical protein